MPDSTVTIELNEGQQHQLKPIAAGTFVLYLIKSDDQADHITN